MSDQPHKSDDLTPQERELCDQIIDIGVKALIIAVHAVHGPLNRDDTYVEVNKLWPKAAKFIDEMLLEIDVTKTLHPDWSPAAVMDKVREELESQRPEDST